MKDINELIKKFNSFFQEKAVLTRKYKQQYQIVTGRDELLGILNWCKQYSFYHLANIVCVDWLEDEEFELVYNLWSYEFKIGCLVKIRIPRARPWAPTVFELWGQAQVYEQEIHEFFGVYFPGNPDLSSLFLHNWHDLPPLRKDFDPVEYSRQAYTVEGLGVKPEYEKEDNSEGRES
ncbi:MAG: NADH-quinone oxidoreductase subunit C [Deltaproteobacteria bacterium]|jgi:NADH-quinone oxidoreductase subunit C|nr:NADH-quinone oxidoreductase subunit C [Deltaproteobacteria bacterium]